jgi:hypothetical protein
MCALWAIKPGPAFLDLPQAERASDGIGAYAKYRIAGGSFDGFFFLHRDNGQLQVGRNGWGRCMPI